MSQCFFSYNNNKLKNRFNTNQWICYCNDYFGYLFNQSDNNKFAICCKNTVFNVRLLIINFRCGSSNYK